MTATRELAVRITGDPDSLARAFNKVEKDSSKLQRSLGKARKAALIGGAALGTGLAAGVVKATNAASDLDESMNKANQTFEKSAKGVQAWSKTTASSLGISRAAALEGASSIGAMLKPMGIAPKEASKMSIRMTQLAADMASFNNQDPTEMLARIRAGLSGESEPLKQFGTVLNETRVKQEAYASGIANQGAVLTETQKIQARYSLLLKDTADQQGDFARTSDGLANSQRIAKAQFQDMAANIGMVFLPMATKLMQGVTQVTQVFMQKWPQIRAISEQVWARVKAVVASVVLWFQTNVAPTIRAVANRIMAFWNAHGDDIKRVFALIQRVIQRAMNVIRAIIEGVMALLRGDWGKVWNSLKIIVSNVLGNIVDIIRTLVPVTVRAGISLGRAVVTGIGNALKGIGSSIRSGIVNGVRNLGNLVTFLANKGKELGKAIINGMIGIVNAGIGRINSALKFTIPGPGPLPDIKVDAPDIPTIKTLARGGFTSGPFKGFDDRLVPLAGNEAVLNPVQQALIPGGRKTLINIFNRTGGDTGRGFASGGWVNPVPGARLGGVPNQGTHSRSEGKPPYLWQDDDAYDLMGTDNMPVYAAGPGVIGRISPFNSDSRYWGHGLYLQSQGINLFYKHLKSVSVGQGQRVEAGQKLGVLGTGVNGGPHLHLAANPLGPLSSIVRAPASRNTSSDPVHGSAPNERKPPALTSLSLPALLGAAGFSTRDTNTKLKGVQSAAYALAKRVTGAGKVGAVSDSDSIGGGSLTDREQRKVNAVVRKTKEEGRKAGLAPDEIAKAAQDREREETLKFLRLHIRQIDAAIRKLKKQKNVLNKDLRKLRKQRESRPGAKALAAKKIRGGIVAITQEINELLAMRAEIVETIRELGAEAEEEAYQEAYDSAQDQPTELDFLEAKAAEAGLTEGTADDLAAAKDIEAFWQRELDAARASGDPRRITAATQGLQQAQANTKAIEDNTQALNENTEALKQSFSGSTTFSYRGQDYGLKSIALPSSDRLTGIEVGI